MAHQQLFFTNYIKKVKNLLTVLIKFNIAYIIGSVVLLVINILILLVLYC